MADSARPAEEKRELTYEERAAKRERSRKKALARSKKRFRRGLFIYTVLFLLLGGAGLAVLWRYLDAYEQGQGKYVMDEFISSRTDEDYLELLLSAPLVETGEFERSGDIVRSYFDASCRGAVYSYRETAGVSTAERPVYSVRAGSREVCRVSLVPAEELSFGFHRWALGSVEPYISPYALTPVSVSIEAPDDEIVSINGSAVGSEYITDADIPCTDLTPLESRYAEAPHRVRYEVDGLYGDLTVTDFSGSEVYPVQEGDSLVYRLGGSAGYSFTVTAPANAAVYICDTLLGESEITARGSDLLEGLEQYTHGATTAPVTYSVSGLYRKPVLRIEAPPGCTLTQTEDEHGAVTCVYAPDEQLRQEQQALVERFFNANMGYGAGNNGYLTTCLEMSLYGSELYNYFANSTAAMIWASDTTIDYEYLNYDSFIPCGADCFTCRVSYKAHLHSQQWYQATETDLEDAYDLVFVRHNNMWYAARMAIVE